MMTTEEDWKPVPGFAGYEASSTGHIRNNRLGHVLQGTLTHKGSIQVNVRGERGRRSAPVHRLVALAFLGPPPAGFVCRHLNDVKTDNRPQNLAWMSVSESIRLTHERGRIPFDHMRGERNPAAKLTADRVRAMRARRQAGETSVALAAAFGVSTRAVDRIVSREAWRHVE